MSLESQIENLNEMVKNLKIEMEKVTSILTERTFPKPLTKYSLGKYAEKMNVHYTTALEWVHNDKIKEKPGVVSCGKINNEYVIEVDEN